jgi:hypothetical protein
MFRSKIWLVTALALATTGTASAQKAPVPGAAAPAAPATERNRGGQPQIRMLVPTGAEREALAVLKKRGQQNATLAALARSNAIDMETVNQSAVPVLVVPSGALAANLSIVATKDHYVASSGDEITGVVITGTRITTTIGGNTKLPRLDPKLAAYLATLQGTNPTFGIKDPVVSDSEDGIAVSFRRFGMLYEMRISCAKANDPHCTAQPALQLATQTLVLGGGQ